MSDGTGSSNPAQGSPTLIVSACLLGVRCTHVGDHNLSDAVVALRDTHRLVAVCPETAGGLPTPRAAAEVGADGTVRTEDGNDVSDAYTRGAMHAVRLARATGASRAVLKARSPSCGCHEIYDGTFTGTKVTRPGVTAAALLAAGVEVVSEEDLT